MAGGLDLGQISVTLTAIEARFNKTLDDAEQRLKGTDQKMTALTKSSLIMRAAFGVAGVAVAVALTRMAAAAIKFGDEMQKGMEISGTTARELSELSYAARTLGIDTAGTADMIRELNENISRASTGSEKHAVALAAIGVSVKQLLALSPAARFERVAEGISQLAEEGDRARAAVTLLGGAGSRLLPLLNEGARGVQKLREEAVAMGQSFSDDTVKKLADADDAIDRLSESWTGLSTVLTAKVAPALTALFDLLHGELPKSSLESQIANIEYTMKALQGTTTERGLKKLEELRARLIVLQSQVNPIDDFASRQSSARAGGGSAVGFQKADAEAEAEKKRKAAAEKAAADRLTAEKELAESSAQAYTDSQNEIMSSTNEFFADQLTSAADFFASELEQQNAADEAKVEARYALLDTMRLASMTEEQIEAEKYQTLLDQLASFSEDELAAVGDYQQLREQIEREHMERLMQIRYDGFTELEKLTGVSWTRQANMITGQIANMTAGVASGNKKLFELNKAASLAQAIVSLPAAIIESYKNAGGYPFGIAAAAAMAAVGAAQIAQIKNAKFGGGLAPSQAGTPATPVAPAARQVISVEGISRDALFSGQSVRDLIERINEAQRDGARLVIS